MIDVLVVAEIPLYREGMVCALGHGGRVHVLGTATSSEEALSAPGISSPKWSSLTWRWTKASTPSV